MTISYVLVSRGNNVLAEHTAADCQTYNHTQVARMVLQRFDADGVDRQTIEYEDVGEFNCIKYDGITFLCLAESGAQKRLILGFLEDISALFMKDFSEQANTAFTLALNAAFAPTLQDRMDFFNGDQTALQGVDKIGHADKLQHETIDRMEKAIETAVERGAMIDTLIDKTERLDQEAHRFRRAADDLKRKFCMKKYKKYCCICFFLLFIMYGIMVAFCGGINLPTCINNDDDGGGDDSESTEE